MHGDFITLLFATGNAHKFREAQEILKPYGIMLEQIRPDHPEIRADDVEEVALDSAKNIHARVKKPLIVDDSGLFIHALGNFPGAYSEWVQKKLGNKGILKLMEGQADRTAHFKACVAYCDGKVLKSFCGRVNGTIAERESGNGGFGYDPIFVPENEKETFAENETLKNRISHRFNAFTDFAKWYTSYTR